MNNIKDSDRNINKYFKKNKRDYNKEKQIIKHILKEYYKNLGVRVLVKDIEVNYEKGIKYGK